MKKEYLILALLILSLSGYLVFKKEHKSPYKLPDLAAIEAGKIDKLVILKQELTIELTKENDNWKVTEQKFPASTPAVNDMMDAIRNLKISALISETRDLVRYELDQDHRIEVKAFQGGTLLRQFMIGKTAPSFNHTFVMLADDPRIYQADKSFTQFFHKNVGDLRDKKVLNFKDASIKKITLEKEEISKTLIASSDGKEESEVSWKYEDGTSPDKESLTNLLSSLSYLACENFSDGISKIELEQKVPLAKITLDAETPMVLTIFTQENGEPIPATSSMTPYAFVLESFKAKDILSYVDTLAGVEKKEAP